MAKKEIEEKVKNKNSHEVVIKIEGTEWEKAIDKAFQKKVKEVKIDGFRQGKVPRDVFEKKYGKESLFMDAADAALQDAYMKAMEETTLVPVVQPQVNLKSISDTGVEFAFVIITKPEVTVKKYKGFKIVPEEVVVTSEEMEHEISHILERYTELAVKEGSVALGDVAIIDFEGFNKGVAFEGGKGENYSLEIGSNTFIPGFEEQVIGLNEGEEKDIIVTFPEEYPSEDLKGQEVTFKIKVNEIKTKVQRELDAELFEDLAMEGVTSRETLENEIEASIKARKEMEAENKYIDTLLETISKEVEVDIPEEMVEEEVNRLISRFEENMKMQGVTLDVYYQFTHSTEADLRSQMEKEGYKNVLYRLMMESIVTMEDIKVTEEDSNKEADELAVKYQMEKEEFLKLFGGLEMIRYDLEMRKVIEFLKENNK